VDTGSLSGELVAPGVGLIVVAGEADLVSPRLAEELGRVAGEGATSVVVDCSGLSFLDTTTIDELVEATAGLGRDNLYVVAPSGDVRRILELTLLDQVLPLYRTRGEALAAATAAAA
jgi:anti-sigma B factor antagonist